MTQGRADRASDETAIRRRNACRMAPTARWVSAEPVRSGGPGQNGSDGSGALPIGARTLVELDGIVQSRTQIRDVRPAEQEVVR
jgi:hypothetical protein